jgi:hypothetical protein
MTVVVPVLAGPTGPGMPGSPGVPAEPWAPSEPLLLLQPVTDRVARNTAASHQRLFFVNKLFMLMTSFYDFDIILFELLNLHIYQTKSVLVNSFYRNQVAGLPSHPFPLIAFADIRRASVIHVRLLAELILLFFPASLIAVYSS